MFFNMIMYSNRYEFNIFYIAYLILLKKNIIQYLLMTHDMNWS